MHGKGPAFIQNNFEILRAQEQQGPGAPVVRRWARLTERSGLDPVSELILMGDVLPPGAMRAMQRQGPLSSINWSFNLPRFRPGNARRVVAGRNRQPACRRGLFVRTAAPVECRWQADPGRHAVCGGVRLNLDRESRAREA